MKISKERLMELVKEELSISLGSVGNVGGDMIGGSEPHISSDGDGYMVKQNLWKISEYAGELYQLLKDSDDLEPWVQEKVAIAAFLMDSVGHYIEYVKHREHEAAEGDEDTLEPMEEPEMPGEEEDDEEDEEVYSFEPDEDLESDEDDSEEYDDEEGDEEEVR